MKEFQAPADFRLWLSTHCKMQERSVSDVCSRLKRLTGIVKLDAMKTEVQLHAALIQSPAFAAVSGPVRSQLKRAGNLYIEFRTSSAR
jgi:hypothetical protein